MTIALAIEYIPKRMNDIGVGTNYYLRFRHYVLQAGEVVEIDAHNQFFILVHETSEILIESDFGYFDLSDTSINEQSYEHQGSIVLNNYSSNISHIRFIQVIPKN